MDIILKLNELLKKEDFREELCALIKEHLCHPSTQENEIQQEPKFKVGDWVMDRTFAVADYHGEPGQIVGVSMFNGEPHYRLMGIDGMLLENGILINEHYIEKWTIDDAKDGDVLVCKTNIKGEDKEEIGIVKQFVGKHGGCNMCFTSYCYVDWQGDFRVGEYIGSKNIFPATKEQRETLFKAMADAGYEWSEETHELKKIVTRWRDDEEANIEGYFIDSEISEIFHTVEPVPNKCWCVFATEVQAKSALAMARISQIMANDPRFGGVVTDEEWHDDSTWKYFIYRKDDAITTNETGMEWHFLAFHTEVQRGLFLEENEDLIHDFFMLPKKGE